MLSAPEKLRRATEVYRTPEHAAESLGINVIEFANQCLEYGILWPDTMIPAQLSTQRRDAGLAGELTQQRQQFIREYAA